MVMIKVWNFIITSDWILIMETFSYFIFINMVNAPDFNTFFLKVKQMIGIDLLSSTK